MEIFLETGRLALRRLTMDDADHLVALHGDPEVMRFLTGGRPNTREEIEREWLPQFLSYYERCPSFGYWAVIEQETGAFLGWCCFRPFEGSELDEVELGYRLNRSAWGKGYATELARALIDKGFRELGVRRVMAQTMTVNLGSRRVMEKAGLHYVRTFFEEWPESIPGSEHGDVEYAITRKEWEQKDGVRAEQPTAGDSPGQGLPSPS